MNKIQIYQEKISTIKSAFEMLDYSDEYDEHRYRTLQKQLVSTMNNVLKDDEVDKAGKDALFKMMSIILGYYIDCREDYDEFVPKVEDFVGEGLITPEQWNFFKDQLVFNP